MTQQTADGYRHLIDNMPLWLTSGLWGLLGGSALLIGAAVGFFSSVRQRTVAGVMAF